MGELVNREESAIVPEGFYKQVSSILNAARDKAYTAVNFAMVEAYWEIGKSIVDEQGGEGRAKYGEALLKTLAIRLTKDLVKVLKQESCVKCVSSILHFQFGTHCVPN